MNWSTVVAKHQYVELWQCTRILNPRGNIVVLVTKSNRFRSDTKQKTSRKSLEKDDLKLQHRLYSPP